MLKRCAATVCCCAVFGSNASAQQEPNVVVELRRGDEAPAATLSIRGLLSDSRFLSAMRSGFPLYLEYQVELRETRSNWFDRRVSEEFWEYVILYDPVREVFVWEDEGGREVLRGEAALRRRLEAVYVVEGLTPDHGGRFYYAATVTARTLSDSDVDEVFEWLKGDDDTATVRRPGFLTRSARRLLVQVAPLPRMRLSSRTGAFPWP